MKYLYDGRNRRKNRCNCSNDCNNERRARRPVRLSTEGVCFPRRGGRLPCMGVCFSGRGGRPCCQHVCLPRQEVCFHHQPFVPRRPLGREPACNNFIFFTSHLTKLSCGDTSTNSINSL